MDRAAELERGQSDIEESVARFLKLTGRPSAVDGVPAPLGSSPEDLVRHLESRGLAVEVVRLAPGDMRRLEGPALLQVGAGWRLVERQSNCSTAGAPDAPEAGVAVVLAERLEPLRSLRDIGDLALRSQRRLLVRSIIAGLAIAGVSLLPPYFVFLAVGESLEGLRGTLLPWIGLGILAVALLQTWIGLVRDLAIQTVDSRLELSLGGGFLHHLLSLRFSFLHRQTVGDLLQALNALDIVRRLFAQRASAVALDLATALVYLGIAAVVLPSAVPSLAAVAAVALALTATLAPRQARLRAEEIEARSRGSGFLVAMIRGIASVKAGASEASVGDRWRAFLDRELTVGLQRMRLDALGDAGHQALRVGAPLFALLWGGAAVLEGRSSFPTLLMLLAVITGFATTVSQIAVTLHEVVVARPEIDRVREILAEEPHSLRRTPVAVLTTPVRVADVWFRYQAATPWVFKGLELRVEPGERVHLVGPSGCGKTTLLRLLAGFYAPTQGRIRIEGEDPARSGPRFLYLPQVVTLFGGTLFDNLEILSGGSARERILAAACETGLADWVEKLPMRYDTLVPLGGGTFSGGERQLIALTAAAASEAPLLLLDEPLSNLDRNSGAAVVGGSGFQGKTIVYVSHEETIGSWWRGDRRVQLGRSAR